MNKSGTKGNFSVSLIRITRKWSKKWLLV